jgi:hypothetical protein
MTPAMIMAILGIVGAVGGGIAGGIGLGQQTKRAQAEIDFRRQQETDSFELAQAFAQDQFDLQREQTLAMADLSEGRLMDDLSLGTDAFNNSLFAQALGMQDANINLTSQIGQMEANAGYSGVQGNQTNSMIAAYATEGLTRQGELQGRQNQYALGTMMNQANNAMEDINLTRDNVNIGGYAHRAFEMQKQHGKDMFDETMQNYDFAAQQAKPGAADWFTAILGGGSSGLNLANNIGSYARDWTSLFKEPLNLPDSNPYLY